MLADSSPDGWAYSTGFAQFSFITEAQVRAALPTGPAPAVDAFMARWRGGAPAASSGATRIPRMAPWQPL